MEQPYHQNIKILKIILFAFISLLVSSCERSKLVDESKSDSYFYSSDKSKILYKRSSSPDVSKLWNYEWVEVPADAKSFKVMNGGFGKDDKHIFFGAKILENVDYNTFQKIENSDNYMDKNNVYSGDLKIVKDADPNTYQVIKSVVEYYSNEPVYNWAKDNKHFFYENKLIEVDYKSFKILNTDIMADNNFIYGFDYKEFFKIPNKNKTSEGLTVLSDNIVFSPKYLYFKYFPTDTRKGFSEVPIKNPSTIKKYGYGSYFTIDGIVYYEMLKIENADLNTFETFINERAERFAKDKNHFYVRDKALPNVNPKDVIYDAKKDKFSYLGKFWNFKTEKFDKENSD